MCSYLPNIIFKRRKECLLLRILCHAFLAVHWTNGMALLLCSYISSTPPGNCQKLICLTSFLQTLPNRWSTTYNHKTAPSIFNGVIVMNREALHNHGNTPACFELSACFEDEKKDREVSISTETKGGIGMSDARGHARKRIISFNNAMYVHILKTVLSFDAHMSPHGQCWGTLYRSIELLYCRVHGRYDGHYAT